MAKQRGFYLLLLTLSFAAFIFWEDYIVHLLFYFLLLLPLASLAVSLPFCFLLRCRIALPATTAAKGKPVLCKFVVRNRYLLPTPRVKATLEYENMLGGYGTKAREKLRFPVGFAAEAEIPLTVSFPYCGQLRLQARRLFVSDLLGLFMLPVLCGKASPRTVYVTPDQVELFCTAEEGVDLGQESTMYSTRKPGNDPSEIFRLREYRPGDRPHAIHWKLSARLDRLMVREFGLPLNASTHYLVELGPEAGLRQADRLLDALISLAMPLTEEGVVQTVSWLSSDAGLTTQTVAEEDALAQTLHELLSLRASRVPDQAVAAFAREQQTMGCHLVYLVAPDASCKPGETLLRLLRDGTCRRISVLTAGAPQAFDSLRGEADCRVYRLDDGLEQAGLKELKL